MRLLITGASGFIGTNYLEFAITNGIEVMNIDIKPPINKFHQKYYKECDIMDYCRLERTLKDFKPTHLVHLAAKTGAHFIRNLNQFAPNIEGVRNLINACLKVSSIEHVIFTSSLLVCRVGYIPKSDTDYLPNTAYGLSKVEGEKIIRNWIGLPFKWTIIRPISVWGPWMEEPYLSLFKAIAKGWYVHINHGHYKRSMGYVENIAYEIHSIFLVSEEKTNKKTFYLGDPEPTDLFEFTEEIRKKLNAPKIKKVPLSVANLLAKVGDLLKCIGWINVPITSFRLNNIITEYVFDLSPIVSISGQLPFNKSQGIERTIGWLKYQKII